MGDGRPVIWGDHIPYHRCDCGSGRSEWADHDDGLWDWYCPDCLGRTDEKGS